MPTTRPATVTQAISTFLRNRLATHNGPDLIERFLAQDGMETQVVVHRGDGEPVDEKHGRFTDGVRTWGPIRIAGLWFVNAGSGSANQCRQFYLFMI
jgi:hypothetical protein